MALNQKNPHISIQLRPGTSNLYNNSENYRQPPSQFLHSRRHFYNQIAEKYGPRTKNELQEVSRHLQQISKIKNRLQFYRRCIDEYVFPKFLNFKIDHLNYSIRDSELLNNFKFKIL